MCIYLAALALPLGAAAPVRYELKFPNAAHHEAGPSRRPS
jgi:hypothetical protein